MSGAEMQESSLLQPNLHGASTGEKRTRAGSNFGHDRNTKLSITGTFRWTRADMSHASFHVTDLPHKRLFMTERSELPLDS